MRNINFLQIFITSSNIIINNFSAKKIVYYGDAWSLYTTIQKVVTIKCYVFGLHCADWKKNFLNLKDICQIKFTYFAQENKKNFSTWQVNIASDLTFRNRYSTHKNNHGEIFCVAIKC